jgi:uncharacterized protein (TIGR03435 family)
VKQHNEKKEYPIFALVLAKGPTKLKELPPDPNEDKVNDEPVGMANVATIAAVGNGSHRHLHICGPGNAGGL